MTNPFRLLKLYRRADALVSVMDESAKRPALYQDATYLTRLIAAIRGLWLELPLPPEVKELMFLKAMLKNWKTTVIGLAMIFHAAATVVQDPSKVFDKVIVAEVMAGAAAMAAKDGDKTGVPAVAQ